MRKLPFPSVVKHVIVIEKHVQLPFLYGASREQLTFEQLDILASKESLNFTEMWSYMQKQYTRYIINKIVVQISNVTIESRYQQCADPHFSWDDTAKFPFTKDFYEHNTDSRNVGQYMLVHRSRVEADGDLLLKNSIVARNKKIYQKGGARYYFYPRCTKSVGIADILSQNTLCTLSITSSCGISL